jgi:hypothetical protein
MSPAGSLAHPSAAQANSSEERIRREGQSQDATICREAPESGSGSKSWLVHLQVGTSIHHSPIYLTYYYYVSSMLMQVAKHYCYVSSMPMQVVKLRKKKQYQIEDEMIF